MQKKNTEKTLSNLTGVGFFLDWEKLYQLPLGREKKEKEKEKYSTFLQPVYVEWGNLLALQNCTGSTSQDLR